MSLSIDGIDALVCEANAGRFGGFWGWHDDHAAADQTERYRPALQQVRGEFAEFLKVLDQIPERGGALQLGMGACEASHEVWRTIFHRAVTIDWGICVVDDSRCRGCDTHDPRALAFADTCGPYDLLFIDAGHGYADVEKDHTAYAPLVRAGGVVAFHDAAPRERFPEVMVWRYLADRVPQAQLVGSEVGIAWYRK